MPATVTLAQTTLTAGCRDGELLVRLASLSGVTPGRLLFVEGELMQVVAPDAVNGGAEVMRGVDGTSATDHDPGSVVYIADGGQLYASDPSGKPALEVPVSPWINVRNGSVWFAQGDYGNANRRWWQRQEATYGIGSLGVRTVTYEPAVST